MVRPIFLRPGSSRALTAALDLLRQVEQYAKLIKVGLETNWRSETSSINYIETSTLWRQEHNGYSHQNPGFIGSLLALPSQQTRVYLPPDANTSVSTIAHVLRSKSQVNRASERAGPCFQ